MAKLEDFDELWRPMAEESLRLIRKRWRFRSANPHANVSRIDERLALLRSKVAGTIRDGIGLVSSQEASYLRFLVAAGYDQDFAAEPREQAAVHV